MGLLVRGLKASISPEITAWAEHNPRPLPLLPQSLHSPKPAVLPSRPPAPPSLPPQATVPATIIGAGRVGQALAGLNPAGTDVVLRRGQTVAADGLPSGPIYVCTRNDDLVPRGGPYHPFNPATPVIPSSAFQVSSANPGPGSMTLLRVSLPRYARAELSCGVPAIHMPAHF